MKMQIGTWHISVAHVRPTDEQLLARYDLIAQNWHQSVQRLGFMRAYSGLFACLQDQLPTQANVLDCGVGTGELSITLTQHHPVKHITGVDISHEMLRQASRRLQPVSHTLEQHDMRHLPYADEWFDMVMTAHTLEHLPTMADGLREMKRVLRPGGVMVVVMTRQTAVSAWLQVQWHLHTTTDTALQTAMREVGLKNVTRVPLGSPFWCNWMSVACIGTS